MATIRKPKHKICRSAGFCLYGNPKCPSKKRPFPPGYRPESFRKKKSPYGEMLLEKQKLRFTYGMMERQFRNTFEKASRMHGNTADNFLILLESRLMTLIYRLCLAKTAYDARQLISHGHITVNGKRVTIPSYHVRVGDIIGVHENSRELERIKDALKRRDGSSHPVPYLEVQADGISGKFLGISNIQDIPIDPRIDIQKIIEYYSK